MKAFQIEDVKGFMEALLIDEVFDRFLLVEMDLRHYASFHVDGKRNTAWYDAEEKEQLTQEQYLNWADMKSQVYQWMKGRKTPLLFSAVLRLSDENTAKLIQQHQRKERSEEVGGLFLNIRYERQSLMLTTGCSLKNFSMDRSLEHQWEEDVVKFLKQHNITSTQIK